MIAIALKNSILICLIVSIGYFIIDNHLSELKYEVESDKSRQKKPKVTTIQKKSPKSSVAREIVKENEENKDVVECDSTENTEEKNVNKPLTAENMKMKISIDNNMKEIYSYVYGDSRAPNTLNAMYKTTKNGEVEKDLNVLCETSEEDKYKRMCNDPIKDHHESIDYAHIESKPISDASVYKFVDDNL